MVPHPSDAEPPRKKARTQGPGKKRGKKPHDDPWFKLGGHGIVSGASGRGKTYWLVDAILGKGVHRESGPGPWNAITVLCDNVSVDQDAFQRLAKQFTGKGGVTFYEGLPDNPEEEDEFLEHLREGQNNGLKRLILIDDLMKASSHGFGERFVDKLFTSCRHLGCTVFELNQAHTANRLRRLNAAYLVCFSTPSDVRALAHVAHSIMPEDKGKRILECYREATEDPEYDGHGCLVVCLHANPEYMLRATRMDHCFDLHAPDDAELQGPEGADASA